VAIVASALPNVEASPAAPELAGGQRHAAGEPVEHRGARRVGNQRGDGGEVGVHAAQAGHDDASAFTEPLTDRTGRGSDRT
jgi:hypothetical protein